MAIIDKIEAEIGDHHVTVRVTDAGMIETRIGWDSAPTFGNLTDWQEFVAEVKKVHTAFVEASEKPHDG